MSVDVRELKKGETGQRVNLRAAYKWVLEEMSYKDFCRFAKLRCFSRTGNYPFSYTYMVSEKDDNKKTREEYIKYLMYKLIQNLDTPDVELIG